MSWDLNSPIEFSWLIGICCSCQKVPYLQLRMTVRRLTCIYSMNDVMCLLLLWLELTLLVFSICALQGVRNTLAGEESQVELLKAQLKELFRFSEDSRHLSDDVLAVVKEHQRYVTGSLPPFWKLWKSKHCGSHVGNIIPANNSC